ncbi:tumor necrosis factor ligand superfamily member 4 [Ctenodactylus gundi]
MEGVQPLDRNVGGTPRSRFQLNKLLLVASVIQGLGLLLFLTYICLHFYAPQEQHPSIQSIKVLLTGCEKEKISLNVTENPTMDVQNNSIIVNCDGFYLISVRGYFHEEVSISLHYQNGETAIPIPLMKNSMVDFTTVASLLYKDMVYLHVDTVSCENFGVNGGELILIQQNPGGYCAH